MNPIELKQDIKAIENESIKSRLEYLKESSVILWTAKKRMEAIIATQSYIANYILKPIFADSKVWVADMNYGEIVALNDCDTILMPFIIGEMNSQGEWELKNNYINQHRAFRHIFHINDEGFESLEIMLYQNSDFENLPNFKQQYSKAIFTINEWFNKTSKDNLAQVAKLGNEKAN